jgi:hypothetical protein
MNSTKRMKDLEIFYSLLDDLEIKLNGKRKLEECDGRMNWPKRGVYFFFSSNKNSPSENNSLRVTRVGTHAVSLGSKTSLWDRLRTHRGPMNGKHMGGGNHRGSIFRLRIGEAMINKYSLQDSFPNWGKNSSASKEIRDREYPLEKRVSNYIRSLPFVYVKIEDEPSRDSDRAYIERNSIALLSNFSKEPIEPRNKYWLGRYSPNREIRESELWNTNHVAEKYDPKFLDVLRKYVEEM